MGLDPGSRVTGYGVIAMEGNHLRCLGYGGLLALRKNGANDLPSRLTRIYQSLCELLELHAPEMVAVEDVFHSVNAKSALQLGQARGVILLAAGQLQIPLFEYSALQVKKAVVGYGRATKPQVQIMVKTLLKLSKEPQPHDAADALAIAICHAFNNPRLALQGSQTG